MRERWFSILIHSFCEDTLPDIHPVKSTTTVRLCVPVGVRRADDLPNALARAAEVADVIELRLDYLERDQLFGVLDELGRKQSSLIRPSVISQPIVLTFRPLEQGGERAIDQTERELVWRRVAEVLGFAPSSSAPDVSVRDTSVVFADLELDAVVGRELQEVITLRWGWDRTICSHHDFSGVPANLEEPYELMVSTPARILKIAVRANSVTDCVPVFRLLDRARRENRALIAIAMGEAGVATRILGPSRGSYLTYGALDDDGATAPGQVLATELRDLYRINSITEQTQITGLVGLPVAHSVSPHMHNRAFAACGIDAVYIPFEVRDMGDFVRRMVRPTTREINWNLRGLSVTAPHKSAIMEHLDWISPEAKEIGAVNTIVIEGDALRGYNTDAAALLLPLQGVIDLRGARVAVIGAGGAARAALYSLQHADARVTVYARDIERATQTAENFGAHCEQLDRAKLNEFDVVINATPLGTRGQSEGGTPTTTAQMRGVRVAYDLVYNPAATRFMREAQAAGCKTISGLAMLVAQAAAQFKLWSGRDAPQEVMRQAAEKQMAGA